MARRDEPTAGREEPRVAESDETKKIEVFGMESYLESAKALRGAGARVVFSIGAAVLIWLVGDLVFIPIAEGMTDVFLGYPVKSIISLIIAVVLAVIIFTVFIDIRRLTSAIAGVAAYEFGKASGEARAESIGNYKTALSGILYILVVSVAYLLFAKYLGNIHPAIPAILLILIVIWSVFALWRSMRAIAAEIGRYTTKLADELEKRVKKT